MYFTGERLFGHTEKAKLHGPVSPAVGVASGSLSSREANGDDPGPLLHFLYMSFAVEFHLRSP